MFIGIVIGMVVLGAAIGYYEIRHAYFNRKVVAPIAATAQEVLAQAKAVADAAAQTVDAVKAGVLKNEGGHSSEGQGARGVSPHNLAA